MKAIDVSGREIWAIKGFLALSSSDLFFENRSLFKCDFYSIAMQRAVKDWLQRLQFDLPPLHGAAFQTSLDELAETSQARGVSIDPLLHYALTGADPVDGKAQNAYHRWVTALVVVSAESVPTPSDPAFRDAMGLYDSRVKAPKARVSEFFTHYRKEWDCHAAGPQKDYNLRTKTEWDARLYEQFCIKYEYSLSDGLSSIFGRNAMAEFVALLSASYSSAQRRMFYDQVIQSASADKDLDMPDLTLDELFLQQPA